MFLHDLIFGEEGRVVENCGSCLSMDLCWEKFGSQENMGVRENLNNLFQVSTKILNALIVQQALSGINNHPE
jgi:hypothetical protein